MSDKPHQQEQLLRREVERIVAQHSRLELGYVPNERTIRDASGWKPEYEDVLPVVMGDFKELVHLLREAHRLTCRDCHTAEVDRQELLAIDRSARDLDLDLDKAAAINRQPRRGQIFRPFRAVLLVGGALAISLLCWIFVPLTDPLGTTRRGGVDQRPQNDFQALMALDYRPPTVRTLTLRSNHDCSALMFRANAVVHVVANEGGRWLPLQADKPQNVTVEPSTDDVDAEFYIAIYKASPSTKAVLDSISRACQSSLEYRLPTILRASQPSLAEKLQSEIEDVIRKATGQEVMVKLSDRPASNCLRRQAGSG